MDEIIFMNVNNVKKSGSMFLGVDVGSFHAFIMWNLFRYFHAKSKGYDWMSNFSLGNY